jgi:predicted ATPase
MSGADFGLPEADFSVGDYRTINPFPERTRDEHDSEFHTRLGTLNAEQTQAIVALQANLDNTNPLVPKCLFIEGPGGTGKTYLIEVLFVSITFIALFLIITTIYLCY